MSDQQRGDAFIYEVEAAASRHGVHGFVVAFSLASSPTKARSLATGWGDNTILTALHRTLDRVYARPQRKAHR